MQLTTLEHPRFRIIPRKSKRLVIFFSGSSTPDNEFRWWKIANRVEASAILVNNGPNEWYQGGIDGLGGSINEVASVFRDWAEHLGATRIYTVGTSMGGAGALLYGAKLDARVLAFAAETRMTYPRGNVRRLLRKDFVPPYPDLRPLIAGSRAIVDLISGESEPVDLISAMHVADLPNVNATTLRRVPHGPPNYLKARDRLDPLLNAFLADQPLPDFPEEGRGLTPGYAEALYDAYCADLDKDYPLAEARSRDALAVYPDAEKATALLGKAILQQKRPHEALSILHRAVTLHPTAEHRLLLAACLTKADNPREAVVVLKALLEKYPRFARGWYSLGNIYDRAGSYYSAYKMLLKAAALEPDNEAFTKRLVQVHAKVPKDAIAPSK